MASQPAPAPQSPAATQYGPHRFATLRTTLALILREMSTSYGRTPGGYAWAILEPLGAIMVLSLGFSLVVRTPPLGTSFILFYASGYMPFDLYQVLARKVSKAINFSKPLLHYPAVTWVDAVLARFILNALTGITVTALLLTGILAVLDHRSAVDLTPVIEAMALAMLLGLAVGVMNCVLTGLFPVWDIAWSIITRPLFIASGVFFLYDNMPPLAQQILWYNPLLHITGLMREGFYATYNASYVNHVYVMGVSLAILTLGLILMGRFHRTILNS
ncbi:ABC transporter permease [Pseudodonghicola flavimaris]|uniref:Transport permease protein n=1 Tax=Pseudodonghicola flavimaris TaxID=3050036 RepID=A0ABT7F859_9RHOB|nr:ABC transporter permease [Pseudodonghicola flavimaris]MDK3020799.1 ABC transporter permease [Pseudodonghicola flavimaris]